MNNKQISFIKDKFNAIRRCNSRKWNSVAEEHQSELHGYIKALYDLGIISGEQFDAIFKISFNLAYYGTAKKNIAA